MVVAAWDPELTRFRELAGSLRTGAIGIGLVDAAVGLARVLAAPDAPAAVVFVGTCGTLTPSLAIGDVVMASTVRLVDAATLEGRAALPFGTELAVPPLLDGLRPARVANPLGITTDDALAKAIDADVEHLEAYAVARTAAAFGVPCAVVLAVANEVGARGREQWKANHVEASARAAEALWATLRTSTPRTSTKEPSPA